MFGMENFQLGNGNLRTSLWVRNVFDEDYSNYGIRFPVMAPVTDQYGDPRTYGLDVTWEF